MISRTKSMVALVAAAVLLSGCVTTFHFRLTNGATSDILLQTPSAETGEAVTRKVLRPGGRTKQHVSILREPLSIVAGRCIYTYSGRWWRWPRVEGNANHPIQFEPDGSIFLRSHHRAGADDLETLKASQPPGWPITPVAESCQ